MNGFLVVLIISMASCAVIAALTMVSMRFIKRLDFPVAFGATWLLVAAIVMASLDALKSRLERYDAYDVVLQAAAVAMGMIGLSTFLIYVVDLYVARIFPEPELPDQRQKRKQALYTARNVLITGAIFSVCATTLALASPPIKTRDKTL
jgi:hypothetical protein